MAHNSVAGHSGRGAVYEICLALAAVCFAIVALLFWRSGQCSIYHPLSWYLAFHGFVFVVRPIVAQLAGFRFVYALYQFTPTLADKVTALLGATAGLLAYAAGAVAAGGGAMRFVPPRCSLAEQRRLVRAALWVLAIVAPIGGYSLLWRWDRAAGGVQDMEMDPATGILINTVGNGYLADAQLMLVPVCVLIAWLLRFRLAALVPLAGFIAVRAGIGGRGPFVTAAACLGLLWLYDRRQRFPGRGTVVGGLVIAALFTLVGQDRGSAVRSLLSRDQVASPAAATADLKVLEGMDFSNLEAFEFLVFAVPQRTGTYEYWADHLMLLTEPVPRVVWPDKPIGSPVRMFALHDYGFPVGMTRSLPGEGWVGLGWLGIVGWCGAWGYGFGRAYRWFVTGRQSPFAVLGYMLLLAMQIVAYRDGTLITVARMGLFYAPPVVLWALVARSLRVPTAPEPGRALPAVPMVLPRGAARRRLALRRAPGPRHEA